MKGVGVKILRIGLSNVVLAYFITGRHDTTIMHIYILVYVMEMCRRVSER